MTLYREWRKRIDQAGILVGHIYIIHRVAPELEEEARRIYEKWKREEISFEKALEGLEKLVDRARKHDPLAMFVEVHLKRRERLRNCETTKKRHRF